ncbi:MAG: PQQ-dependent sugar dehydrogenase [Anaerolineae bacterium]
MALARGVLAILLLLLVVGCGGAPTLDAESTLATSAEATVTLASPVATASSTPLAALAETLAPTARATAMPTPAPAASPTTAPTPTSPALLLPGQVDYAVEVVATGLAVPWALAFDDAGALYLTERPGRLRVIREGVLDPVPVADLPVAATGEGGLLGLALDPAFSSNGNLYLMYTLSDGGGLWNRISRYKLTDAGLQDEMVLVDRIPGARNHDGGRLAFGPDGRLYATTGDAGRPALAQDLNSLAGKILRMNPDGSVPDDNPFPGLLVYSYGHRNPQGLAWHPDTGVLYSVEHGPSGEFGSCCRDEFNRIVPGGNYGWPWVAGNDVLDAAPAATADLIAPILSSGTDTWAPASLAFYQGAALAPWEGLAFLGMLRGSDVQRVELGGPDLDQVAASAMLVDGTYGRIRDVVPGPDGYLYFTTSNQDGRGWPATDDDRVLRIVPAQ